MSWHKNKHATAVVRGRMLYHGIATHWKLGSKLFFSSVGPPQQGSPGLLLQHQERINPLLLQFLLKRKNQKGKTGFTFLWNTSPLFHPGSSVWPVSYELAFLSMFTQQNPSLIKHLLILAHQYFLRLSADLHLVNFWGMLKQHKLKQSATIFSSHTHRYLNKPHGTLYSPLHSFVAQFPLE